MKNSLLNIIGFQIGWFSCVLGAANNMPWLGPLVTVPIIGWHLSNSANAGSELKLILIVALCGSLFDQALLTANLVQYPSSGWPASLLPLWMVTLWLLFSTTLNVSLRWLRSQPAIALLFGAAGGPLAYAAGAKFGAMQLHSVPELMVILAIDWALMMLAMLRLSTRLDGYAGATDARLAHDV